MIIKKSFYFIFFAAFLMVTIPPSVNGGVNIIAVSPPEIFNLSGSETNFVQVCTLGEALNLVLDVVGKNKITFQEPIVDMCDNNTIENLDKYIQSDKTGEVTVDSDSLPYLKDKAAIITMRNLPFEEEPDIEVDGKLATSQDVAGKTWDQSSQTLTFEAKHFTTYKAVPKFVVNEENPFEEESTVNIESKTSEPPRFYPFHIVGIVAKLRILLVVIIFLAVIILGYILYRRKLTR